MKGWSLFLFVLAISTTSGQSQSCTASEIQHAITRIASLIEDNYVFKEKGKRISTSLLSHQKNGAFKNVTDWKAFDSICTKLLVYDSKDGHMYVKYDPILAKKTLHKKDPDQNNGAHPFYYDKEAEERNFGFSEVKILEGNIGYIRAIEINLSEKSLHVLFAAMQFVRRTEALIIDLRDNGGGGSAVGSVWETYFLPKYTPLLEFKSNKGDGFVLTTVPWLVEPPYQNPIYVLVNKGTASAAEAFAFVIQHHGRGEIVGQVTAGAAHMNTFYPVNDDLIVSISTNAPVIPGTTLNWEQKGVYPDHLTSAGDELQTAIRLLLPND